MLACAGCSLTPLDDLQSGSAGSSGTGLGGSGGVTSASSSSSSAGSGGQAGAGGAAGECVLRALRDNFSVPSAQWAPYETGGATVEVMGGRMVVTLSETSTDGVGYAGYNSVIGYDVRDCSVIVRVVEPMDPLVNGEFYLGLSRVAAESSRVHIGGVTGKIFTTIGHEAELDNVLGDVGSFIYQWLRIRFAGDHVFFEASSDGAAWFAIRNGPLPFPASDMIVSLIAGTYDVSSTLGSGTVMFDDFDYPP